jgi:small neutral amino acid transporter SnatA (MarC family)
VIKEKSDGISLRSDAFSNSIGLFSRRPAERSEDQEVLAMALLISGVVSIVVGVIGFSLWWNDFIIILKGGVPIILIMGGILAVYVGLDAIQDRAKEERQKQEEKMHKTQQEIDQVKAQAEQYREELERLKEQAKKNNP